MSFGKTEQSHRNTISALHGSLQVQKGKAIRSNKCHSGSFSVNKQKKIELHIPLHTLKIILLQCLTQANIICNSSMQLIAYVYIQLNIQTSAFMLHNLFSRKHIVLCIMLGKRFLHIFMIAYIGELCLTCLLC